MPGRIDSERERATALPAVVLGADAALIPAAAATPPALRAAPEVGDLARALARRWRLALAAAVLASAAVGLAAWKFVPAAKYTTKTMLHVATHRPKVLFDTAERQADARAYQRTQVTIVRSRLVLEGALRKPEVERLPTVRRESDAAEWLEKELQVDFPSGSEILVIAMSGDRPEDLAVLVNAVADSYLQAVHELEHKSRVERLEKLKKLYKSYQDELESRRKGLRELAETAGAEDRETLAMKQQLGLEEISQMRVEQAKLRADLRKAEAEVEVLSARDRFEAARGVSDAKVDWYVEQDPQVRELRAGLVELAGKLAEAKRAARSQGDPSAKLLSLRRSSQAAALEARIAEIRPRIKEDLAEKIRLEKGAELAEAETRVAVLKQHDARLGEEIERLGGQGQELSRNVLDLKASSDEVRIVDDVAKKVGAEAEALDIELLAAPRIVPLHRAEVPRTKDELKRLKIAGGAAAVSFAAALVGVAVWEFRARRISSLEVVVNGLGFRLIGTLPLMPSRARGGRDDPRSAPLVESVDAARTVLIHAARTAGVRTVMITSAVKGEGKTSLACQLAMSLARAGRRTILVDCDFRKSSIHRVFETEASPGVSEVIRGELAAPAAVRPTMVPDLWILPAGSCDAATFQQLACDGLREVFRGLAGEFDFVIVDSAPILPVVDSLLVGQQVDAVLFSIFRDVSRVPDVVAARQRIDALGVRTLGAVVAGATDDPATSSYSYNGPYANSAGA